jgi:hypothetical protein
MRYNLRKFFLILMAIGCLASARAMAQNNPQDEPEKKYGYGIRAGYTDDDPKQFHAGAHFVTKQFWRVITFRPNIECGFGKGAKLYAGNFEFAIKYAQYSPAWSGYVGGGPSINVHKTSPDSLIENGTRTGINFLIGVDNASGLFMEAKAGIMDSPSYKATVGYIFRIHR